MKFIDDREEHNRVLYELGLLEDDDDWPLYQKMMRESIEYDAEALPAEVWVKYLK